MADIYDALLGSDANTPAANADMIARLRNQQTLGQIAALTGVAGLQKMGPALQDDAQGQATLLYKTREAMKDRAAARELQQLEASEREKDRMALGAQASADRASSRQLQQSLTDERLTAGNEKMDDKATAAATKVKDNAAVALSSIDKTIDAVDRLATHPGLEGVYGMQGQFPNYPGGQAAGAKALLDSVVSREGLQGMADMRQQGGTFGRTTNIEFQALQNGVAPLQDQHQSVEQVRQTLAKYRQQLVDAKARLGQAADSDAATLGPHVHTTVSQGFLKGSALPLSRGAAAPAAKTETYEEKRKRLGL